MTDPIARFEDWFAEAVRLEPGVPDAAALATVGASGRPSNRVVLVKAVSAEGSISSPTTTRAKATTSQPIRPPR